MNDTASVELTSFKRDLRINTHSFVFKVRYAGQEIPIELGGTGVVQGGGDGIRAAAEKLLREFSEALREAAKTPLQIASSPQG
jgi:hypothetical protein